MRGFIAAILTLALASSAFGAVTLVAPDQVIPDATGRVNITLSLSNPDGASVWGYGLKATLPAGVATVVARTNNSGFFNDPTAADSLVLNKSLEAIPDLGFSGVVFTDTKATDLPLQTLGLQIAPGATLPAVITFSSVIADIDFNETNLDPVNVTVVPEPASMLLVAAGAAFFARRRRMA